MIIFHARLETSSFRFDAYGRTHKEAVTALRRGWRAHARETGATLKWTELMDGGDVMVAEVELGAAYRDNDVMLCRGGE